MEGKVYFMKKIAVFLADGFEEIEGLTTVDMCRRAGIDVTTVSIKDTTEVLGSHNIPVKADKLFEEVDFDEMDMVVLPGGLKGTENLEASEKVTDILKKFAEEKKFISAICAAPRILGGLGLLEGQWATCYPGNEDKLKGAEVVADMAVISNNFTTGKGMGTSIEFASAIITQLLGEEKAREIEAQIQFS